jgi:integrase
LEPIPEALSVAEGYARWHAQHLVHRKDGGESVHRSMHKDVLPWIGGHPLKGLTRGQITEVLERIVARGASRQAGCVLADVRQLLRWALREGLISDDPSAGLHKNDFGGSRIARSRVLHLEEVRELALKMRASGLAPHIRTAIWLMLATGARIGEVARARWQDLDLANGLWTIPAPLSHHGRAHCITLSRFAVRQLMSTESHRHRPQWVFPSRDDSEALSPKALGKQIRDRQRGVQIRGRSSATTMLLLSGGSWTPLDLRRTAAGLMKHLGVCKTVMTACLDQSARNGPAKQTGQSTYSASGIDDASCREAFERLGLFLESIERASLEHPEAQSID